MSLVYSDTTTKKGIVQFFETECGFTYGDISGDTTKLIPFTADVNMAMDDFTRIAIKNSGKWQYDDSNQTDYPIIKRHLITGQRDYPFTTDESSNLILDIHKVFILPSATATLYQEVYPIDQQSEDGAYGITSEITATGVPYQYDKTSNSLIFDPPSSYTTTGTTNYGLKILISREGSYFVSTDTTKKPGVPGLFHKYFYLKPARDYARRQGLSSLNRLEEEVLKMEGDELRGITGTIANYYANRSRDERPRLSGSKIMYI